MLNLPNSITIIRIFLVPVLVFCILEQKPFWALFVFITASITDGLDGYIARVYHLKTKLGAFLDPLADKLLLLSSYILLALLGRVPLWLSQVVVARDMVILVGILCLFLTEKKIEFSPSMLGKMTTFVQLATIFMVLVSDAYPSITETLWPLYVLNLFVTLVSCVHYLYLGFKMGSSGSVSV